MGIYMATNAKPLQGSLFGETTKSSKEGNLAKEQSCKKIEDLSEEQLNSCFSPELHQSNLDVIWKRLEI